MRLAEPDVDHWRIARDETAVPLAPPRADDCGGRLVLVHLGDGSRAAVVIPDITRHGDGVLEIVAADHLRTRLGLREGDLVSVAVPTP